MANKSLKAARRPVAVLPGERAQQAPPSAGQRRRQGRGPQRPSRSGGRLWWQGPWAIAALVAGVAAVVLAFVVLSFNSSGSRPPSATAAPAQVVSQVTHVSPSVFSAVGADALANPFKGAGTSNPLTGGSGKPELLFMGAEYCPYCAAERWSVIAALSRFGSFSGLQLMRSSSSDVYPNTPTFTFRHARFSSPYLDLATVEMETRSQAPLQQPSSGQAALMSRYDPGGYIPFIDVAGRYVGVGGWTPDMMQGLDWQQVAGSLSDPSSAATKAIVGHTNWLVAAICKATGQKPASVCATPTVQQLESRLG